VFKKVFIGFISIFMFSVNLYAGSMPTVFIGAYSEPNEDTIRNLIVPNTPAGVDDGNWNLTSYTEELLREFKTDLSSNSFNLVLMKEFSDNLKDIVNDANDLDKKIGFFNVDTYQNVDVNGAGEELITITINLIFAQIGEEENRVSEQNNFEVRYTNGITVSGVVEVAANDSKRDEKIHSAYKNFYLRAVYDLMSLISSDTKLKKVSSFSSSDDVFFSIGNVNIGKKAKVLINKVYGDEEKAKKQILMMLQESMIKGIRQDKKLDDIVLLYPDKLNDIIVNNWAAYLERMNEVSLDGSKNNDAEVFVRTINPACETSSKSSREIDVKGYLIEVYLSELYDIVTEKEDVDSIHAIKSSLVSRIVISLKKKNKIDGLSIPSAVIKKKKVSVGQANDGYSIENSLSSVRKNKVAKTIRKSIENLSPKLVDMIKEIKKKRANSFEYIDFCKE